MLTVALVGGCAGGGSEPVDAPSVTATANGSEGESVLEGEPRECTPPPPIPTSEVTSLLPEGIAAPDGSTAIAKIDESGHVTLTFQLDDADGTVSPTTLRARFQSDLEAAGYEVKGGDDEGHESEVFFALRGGGKGVVQAIKSDCPPGTVRLVISYTR